MGADQNNANQSHTVVSTVFTIVIALCILGVLAGIFVDPNALARFLIHIIGNDRSPLVFIVLVLLAILVIVFVLPLWPLLLIFQAFAFGLHLGILANVLSLLPAAAISFWIGISFSTDVQYFITRNFSTIGRLAEQLLNRGWGRLLLFRFAWCPLALRNYAPALFGVSCPSFLSTVIIHSLVLSLIFSNAGSGFRNAVDAHMEADFQGTLWSKFPKGKLWLMGISIVCTLLITVLVAVGFYRELQSPRTTAPVSTTIDESNHNVKASHPYRRPRENETLGASSKRKKSNEEFAPLLSEYGPSGNSLPHSYGSSPLKEVNV